MRIEGLIPGIFLTLPRIVNGGLLGGSVEPVAPGKSNRRHSARRASSSPPGRQIGLTSHAAAFPAERPAEAFGERKRDRVA